MVAVVLVDEEVHRGLAEDAEACGRVTPLERGRVDVAEGLRHEEQVLREQLLPGLDEVHLAHVAVDPARVAEVLCAGVAEEADVQDGLRHQLAHATQRAEQGHRAARRQERAAIPDEVAPLVQEVMVRLLDVEAGVRRVEAVAVPLEARWVEHALVEADAREGLAVPAVLGGVAQHALELVGLRAVVAAALAQEGPSDVAVEVDGLAGARVLGHLKREDDPAFVEQSVLGDLDVVADLAVGVQDREEIVLHLVGLGDAADLEALAVLRDAEHDPTAARVREGRDGLELLETVGERRSPRACATGWSPARGRPSSARARRRRRSAARRPRGRPGAAWPTKRAT